MNGSWTLNGPLPGWARRSFTRTPWQSGAVGFDGFVDLAGSLEGGADVGNDIFAANVSDEVGAGEEPGRLFAGAAEQKGSARGVQAAGELFDGVEAGGV